MVSSEREAEVRCTVHAHHYMRHWDQYGSSLTQGHPQFLTGLLAQGQDDIDMLESECMMFEDP